MEEAANNPLVSVVIPCYNSQAYVGEAIRSALDQTHKNLEVIVIDDGSNDASLQVIKSFGQSVRWETGPNRGAPAARNRGAELARGEFIQFLDADDLLLPEKVETCLHAFTDDLDVVFCSEKTLVEDGGACETVQHEPLPLFAGIIRRLAVGRLRESAQPRWDEKNPLPYLAHSAGLQTARPLHRAETFRELGGFRPDLMCGQESEMHFRMALKGARMKKIEPALVLVRKHGGKHRIGNIENVRARRLEVRLLMLEQAKKAGALDGKLADAFTVSLMSYARALYRSGDLESARKGFQAVNNIKRFPSSGQGPVYDALSWLLGYEKLENMIMRLRKL